MVFGAYWEKLRTWLQCFKDYSYPNVDRRISHMVIKYPKLHSQKLSQLVTFNAISDAISYIYTLPKIFFEWEQQHCSNNSCLDLHQRINLFMNFIWNKYNKRKSSAVVSSALHKNQLHREDLKPHFLFVVRKS